MAGLIAAVYADGREVEQEATEEGTRVRALMPPPRPRARRRLEAGSCNGAGADPPGPLTEP